ncbi:MAG: NAD(P)H-hydrate dehydratase [Tissierellia bacterium]|nr:NAD(P)H-hydrate dehydratase [Tissierellia bacterium]
MLGLDICKISKVEIIYNKYQDQFLKRIFTDDEIHYLRKKNFRGKTIAGLFAAKEAMAKAEGNGIGVNSFHDIKIFHTERGKPYGRLQGKTYEISISHDGDYAIALAFLSNDLIDDSNFSHWKKLLQRESRINKYSAGTIFVRSSKRGMLGAGALVSMAALRTGAGMVYLILPQDTIDFMSVKVTEPVLLSREKSFQEGLTKSQVIIIGPGTGTDEREEEFLYKILNEKKKFVIDADAITILSGKKSYENIPRGAIVTPHEGEFSRLMGKKYENRQEMERDCKIFAKEYGLTMVLKGPMTYVTDGNREYYNERGNSLLATAGSGDVLSGILGALYCRSEDPFIVAMGGVRLHSLLAESYFMKYGQGMVAGDLLKELPTTIKKLVYY